MNTHAFHKGHAPDDFGFPPLEQTHESGILAQGGDLELPRLIAAYRRGIFPYFNPGGPILWWAPDPRAVIYTNELHISRSLRRALRRNDYRITFDRQFDAVIHACAEPRSEDEGTWIGVDMIAAYNELHTAGYAHSIEVSREGVLVGGVYGVAMSGVFFAESMFHRKTNCSKIAIAYLVALMRYFSFGCIDCQFMTDHLARLGAREIPRSAFQQLLVQDTQLDRVGNWSAYTGIDLSDHLSL